MAVSPALPVNNYNYLVSKPACVAGADFTSACYNPRAEYGRSVLDVPHRVILAPIVELPFGSGRRWANGGGVAGQLVGGRNVSPAVNLNSGFPLHLQQARDPPPSLRGTATPHPSK